MGLTRFKDARAGKDGPVSGAIIVVPVAMENLLTNKVYQWAWTPPTGMALEIVGINVHAFGITSDPSLTIGTAKAGAEIVAAVNVTTNLGDLTLVSTAVDSDDTLEVRVTTDTGDAADAVSATIVAYVSAPPTSLLIRGDQGHM